MPSKPKKTTKKQSKKVLTKKNPKTKPDYNEKFIIDGDFEDIIKKLVTTPKKSKAKK